MFTICLSLLQQWTVSTFQNMLWCHFQHILHLQYTRSHTLTERYTNKTRNKLNSSILPRLSLFFKSFIKNDFKQNCSESNLSHGHHVTQWNDIKTTRVLTPDSFPFVIVINHITIRIITLVNSNQDGVYNEFLGCW